MDRRRSFMKLFPALAALPAAAAFTDPQEFERGWNYLPGAWSSIHTLPFPPGSFREFLSFAEGGVFSETNSFLHTSSNLDFSAFGLPSAINASDGVGSWRMSRDSAVVQFRKLLFDSAKINFGDLFVTGTVKVTNGTLHADWHIQVVDIGTGSVLTDFGSASSVGSRIG